MKEKSLRKLIRDIILEDEMGKWLVRGIKIARGDKINNEKDNEKADKKKKNISFMLPSKSKVEEIETKFDEDELKNKLEKINISNSKKKKNVIDFFINLNRFFNNSENYDFEKNLINIKEKEIFGAFASENIKDSIYQYFIDKYQIFKRNQISKKVTEEIKKLEGYIL
jgi:hypothetical protein